MNEEELKRKIREEMTVRGPKEQQILEQHLEKVKRYVQLTDQGKPIVVPSGLSAKLQIALYLIGAAYARFAELRKETFVTNKELVAELGLPEGTVKRALKELRESKWAVPEGPGKHHVNYARFSEILDSVEKSLSKR